MNFSLPRGAKLDRRRLLYSQVESFTKNQALTERRFLSHTYKQRHGNVRLKAGSNVHGMKMQSARVPSIKFHACKTVT
ncbi:hypothetical protein PUN28_009269 [Cardiocondyla obscurior]|uniref:Uncharacterized protein n=1 Tax=Cardiocondyla obscurior TaxID=286306 RepID=A0AAW2FSY7_9HYME